MAAPYGTSADVAGRLPRGQAAGGDFNTTDRPVKAQVTAWIAQVSSRFDSACRAAGFDPAPLAGDGLAVVQFAVVGYVAGMVERAWASVQGMSPDSHGTDLEAPLLDLLKQLAKSPSDTAVMLGLSIPSSAGTSGSSLSSNFFDDPDLSDDTIYPDNTFKRGGQF